MMHEKEENYKFLLYSAVISKNKNILNLIPTDYLPKISVNYENIIEYSEDEIILNLEYFKLEEFQIDYNRILKEICKYGYIKLVKYLVENGANIHTETDLPLRNASKYGQFEPLSTKVERFLVHSRK